MNGPLSPSKAVILSDRSAAESKDLRLLLVRSDTPTHLAGISRYNSCMQHSLEQIRQLAQELPEDQRLLLANSLLESVSDQAAATEAQLAAAWDQEIVRRVTEIKAGTAATCSLDDLTSDLRSIVDR